MMRLASLSLVLVLLPTVAAAEDATPYLSAEAQWQAEIARANHAYAGRRLAILKINDAIYLKDGETAALVGSPEEPSSYRWKPGGEERGAVLTVTYTNGMGLVKRGGESFDILSADPEISRYPINYSVDVTAGLAQVSPGVMGLRLAVYNQGHEEARRFQGLAYFPYDPAFAVTARFDPKETLEPKTFQTSRGWYKQFYYAGDAVFALDGREIRLPLYAGDADPAEITDLSAFFTDALTGSETYGVGRYVDIEGFGAFPPASVIIDLNYAYNPNCARSPHYNCPVAVDEIPVPVRAGERYVKQEAAAH